jgi:hypothetical protein
MRILNTLICVAVCLSLGCAKSGDNASPTSFRVTAHRLIDTKDLLVHHVTIEAPGERFVRVNAEGKLVCQSTLKPVGDASTFRLELTFVATLVKRPDSPNIMNWYMQTKWSGNTIRCPEMIETEAETLSELVQLNMFEGSHSFGQDFVLGEFKNEPIVVLVK